MDNMINMDKEKDEYDQYGRNSSAQERRRNMVPWTKVIRRKTTRVERKRLETLGWWRDPGCESKLSKN